MHFTKALYNRLTIWGFIIVMMMGLAFKLVFLEHPLESDDTTYMKLAELLSVSFFSEPESQLYFRTGILIPLFFLIKVFGYSIFTYYLFSVTFSLLLLFSVLLLARELFGIKVALLTGILSASSYLIGLQSTNLLPDTPAFFWAALSFYFFIRYKRNKSKKYILLLSALSGFMAYLCKEPVLAFFVAMPVYEYYKSKSIKNTLLFASSMLALWLLESLIYGVMTGHFLIRTTAFSKGVSDWIVNQPEVSLYEFFFTSPINILRSTNGKVLFILGLSGAIIALVKKNGKIAALLAGGILIFALYTYSFYSLDPLIPSLPPKTRYITGFFYVLTITSSWTLVTLFKYLRAKIPPSYLQTGFAGIILTIFLLQSIENYSNKNTVLFHNDTYFAANRLLVKKLPDALHDTVYATPVKDFRMYSNFRKLNLKEIEALPESPCYLLFSEQKIVSKLFFADKRRNDSTINFCRNLLYRDDSISIIDNGGIVFSFVRSFNSNPDTIIKFSDLDLDGLIWAEEAAFRVSRDLKKQFKIDIVNEGGKPAYFYTFKSKFNDAPGYDSTSIPFLQPNRSYRIVIDATLGKALEGLTIILSECDAVKRLRDHTLNPKFLKSGDRKWELDFSSAEGAEKFKIYFKVKNNQRDNYIIIKDIVLLEIL
jgi:hypothetical protein